MAIQNEPTRIQIPFADSGTKNVIPDTNSTPSASQAASWTDGFPAQCSLPLSAGGIPPARADFNGILNTMTQSIRYGQEGGVWAWDATVDYAASRVVLGSDGKLYWSVAQSGPNVGGAQDPTADNGTYWQAMPMEDADVVHKTGNESINGDKTFTNNLAVFSSAPYFIAKNSNIEKDTFPASGSHEWTGGVEARDKNNAQLWFVDGYAENLLNELDFSLKGRGSLDVVGITLRSQIISGNLILSVVPTSTNKVCLGYSGRLWKQLYAGTATINTSDERKKSDIAPVDDVVLDAWGSVNFVQYRFNDAISEKGSGARLHNGLIAQDIDRAFKDNNLDASKYGLFCYDEWEEEPERIGDDGEVIQEAQPAGNQYALRYEEALCMEAAYQRRRADRAEARLAALEERLAAIEAKLG